MNEKDYRKFYSEIFTIWDELVCWQLIDDKKTGRKPAIFHATPAQAFERLSIANRNGYGCFWTVNKTNGLGRTAKDITECRALFVDLDGAPIEPVQAGNPNPCAIIESSPNRYHAYWQVSELGLDSFSNVQKALIAKYNADRACHDLSRVLRVPGSYNHKRETVFLVRVI